MISSSPAFLKCHQCKKSPKQFTFLICNHIVCEKCISKNIQFGQNYNSVMCLCGSITHFNEDSEIVEDAQESDTIELEKALSNKHTANRNHFNQTAQTNKKKDYLAKVGFTTSNNSMPSRNSLTQNHPRTSFAKTLSKQTLDQCSKTLINQRSTMPMLEASEVFSLQRHDSSEELKNHHSSSPQKQKYLKGSMLTTQMRNYLSGTQKTRYQESLLLDNYLAFDFAAKKDQENSRARVINEFSTMEVGEGNDTNGRGNKLKDHQNNPKDINMKSLSPKNHTLKDVKNIKESVIVEPSMGEKHRINGIVTNVKHNLLPESYPIDNSKLQMSKTNYHSQFQSQISFLKLLFQKDTDQLEFQFKKVLESISKTYHELEEHLRGLYVEEVITKESTLSLDMSDVIKEKYDKVVGDKFRWLKEKLLLPFSNHQTIKERKSSKDAKHKLNYKRASTPIIQGYKPTNIKQSPQNLSLNQSLPLSNSPNNQQDNLTQRSQRMAAMNQQKVVSQFDTIEQKLQRLTTKPYKQSKEQHLKGDHVKLYNQESSKRIQTENIHGNIKRQQSHEVLNRHQGNSNDRAQFMKRMQNQQSKTINLLSLHKSPTASPEYRPTQKPTYLKQSPKDQTPSTNHPQSPVYFSPPIPYCYKHLQKRQKQAREYISYIEKLCHDKKMKNQSDLFKKVKTSHEFPTKSRQTQDTMVKRRNQIK